MDEYGYIYNKFANDIKKYSTVGALNIKKNSGNYSVGILIVCIIAFIVLFLKC